LYKCSPFKVWLVLARVELDLSSDFRKAWKFEDKTVGINLAVTGAIKDEIIDTVELASILLEHLSKTIRRILRKDTSLNRCRTKRDMNFWRKRAKREAA